MTRAILEFAKPWVLVDYSRRQAEWYDQTYNLSVAQALETRVAMSKSLTNVRLLQGFYIPGIATAGILFLLPVLEPDYVGYSVIGLSIGLQLVSRYLDKYHYRLLSDELILRTDSPEVARQERANFEEPVYKKCARALSRLYRWTGGVR